MSGAAGQKRVPEGFLQNLILPLPPLPTQRRIAAYLDRETARIDALVAEKEALLRLLEEKRASLISHAVTRGLNPKAKLKRAEAVTLYTKTT
jgi:type I restriction enzyme, S subunit